MTNTNHKDAIIRESLKYEYDTNVDNIFIKTYMYERNIENGIESQM